MNLPDAGAFFSVAAVAIFFFTFALIKISLKKRHSGLCYLAIAFLFIAALFLLPAAGYTGGGSPWTALAQAMLQVSILPMAFLFFSKLRSGNKSVMGLDYLHFSPLLFVIFVYLVVVKSGVFWLLQNTGSGLPAASREDEERLLFLSCGTVCLAQAVFYFHHVRWSVARFIRVQKEYHTIEEQKLRALKNAAVPVGLLGIGLALPLNVAWNFVATVFGVALILSVSSLLFICILFFLGVWPFAKNSSSIILSEEELEEIRKKNWLNSFTSRELYLDPELDLDKAARLLKLPKYKLTQLIKHEGHANFNAFVNYYRVERCKVLLESLPDFMVIESMIAESGFQTRSTFFRVFRKYTGLTPKEYMDRKCSASLVDEIPANF